VSDVLNAVNILIEEASYVKASDSISRIRGSGSGSWPTLPARAVSLPQISQPIQSPDLALPFFPPASPPSILIKQPHTYQVKPRGVMSRRGGSKVAAGKWLWENFIELAIRSEEVRHPCTGALKLTKRLYLGHLQTDT
jgi:hypothetical protein